MATFERGDIFHVRRVVEIKDKIGRVSGRFLPGHTYNVTAHSEKVVQTLADDRGYENVFQKGRTPSDTGAELRPKVRGTVNTGAPSADGSDE